MSARSDVNVSSCSTLSGNAKAVWPLGERAASGIGQNLISSISIVARAGFCYMSSMRMNDQLKTVFRLVHVTSWVAILSSLAGSILMFIVGAKKTVLAFKYAFFVTPSDEKMAHQHWRCCDHLSN